MHTIPAALPGGGPYTSFDVALALIVLISTVTAFQKGFIRVLLSFGGLIAGILVASWNFVSVAHGLEQWVRNVVLAQVIAFLLIVSLVMALVNWIARQLRSGVSAVGLGFVDRLLGAGFGFLRGLLLGAAAMMAIAAFAPDTEWVRSSQLAPYFLHGVHALSFVVPDSFQRQIAQGARYLLHETPELLRPHTLQQHM